MAVSTYYIDGSDMAPTDMDGAWNNEANIADGNTGTVATCTNPVAFSGEPGTNAIFCFGTNASGSGDISQVRVRIHDGTSFGWYQTLNAPAGGWTWAAVAGLETFTQQELIEPQVVTFFYADGDIGGTILGVPSVTVIGEGTAGTISKIEVEVTYTASPVVGTKYPLPPFRRS